MTTELRKDLREDCASYLIDDLAIEVLRNREKGKQGRRTRLWWTSVLARFLFDYNQSYRLLTLN